MAGLCESSRADAPWIIARDGEPQQVLLGESEAFGRLLQLQPQSVEWATRWEGWSLEQAQPWGVRADRERGQYHDREQMRAMARRIIWDPQHANDHQGDWSDLAMDNCGTCALAGRGEFVERGVLVPNYAAWSRIYVQAGAEIPAKWWPGFLGELLQLGEPEPNWSMAAALARDVATWGARCEQLDQVG